MKTDWVGHEGHRITNRFSGLWCDTCVRPIEFEPELCHSCLGRGWNRRMTSMYSGRQGKPYRCGNCKGTGKQKPVPCVDCGEPGTILTGHIRAIPSVHCVACYDKGEKRKS